MATILSSGVSVPNDVVTSPGVAVIVTLAEENLLAILFVTVVAKLGSSPKAVANSFSVSRVLGAESTKFVISVLTNAVVAI